MNLKNKANPSRSIKNLIFNNATLKKKKKTNTFLQRLYTLPHSNMQPRHSNPYEHVSDTPTSVRAEVQRGNYCTFLHIWMMLRSIELFPQERVFRRLVALPSSSYRCGAHHPPLEPPSWRVSPSLLAASSSKYFHDKSRYTRVFMPRWRRPRRRWGFPAIVSFPPPLPLLYLHVEWNWFKRAPFFPLLFCTPALLLDGGFACVRALCDFWREFCEGAAVHSFLRREERII